jgi:micrococcal nuclease
MHLKVGSSTLDLNGIPRGMDVAPFIENSRTWVPVRFVAENLAASVYWSQEDQKVTIVQLDQTISMTIGSSEIYVNGLGGKFMDVAPFIRDNRTWVPVRFVSENLGAEVSWNQDDKVVTIVFPGEIGAVTRVVDGDTIHVGLSDGDWSVRLIGINTPEVGQYYYQEAKDKMEELVAGKAVLLQKDVSETDKYRRLLRYAYLGDLFVNAEMVKEGYAQAATYPPDVKYADLFVSLERQARENGTGLWALASTSP